MSAALRRKNKKFINIIRSLIITVIVLFVRIQQQRNNSDSAEPQILTGHCVKVIDGDTFIVNLEGGKQERIRILGIDCMETYQPEKLRKQANYYNVSTHEIRSWGETAKKIANKHLEGNRVKLVFPDGKISRDSYNRLLCYVETDRDFGGFLIRSGWAEYRKEPHSRKDDYQKLWNEARRLKKGMFQNTHNK